MAVNKLLCYNRVSKHKRLDVDTFQYTDEVTEHVALQLLDDRHLYRAKQRKVSE